LRIFLSSLLVLAFAGCQPGTPQVAPPEAPAVPVSHPVERQVTDYVEFTGQTHAKDAVNIVPRVTGYLINIAFKEGSEVKGPENPAMHLVRGLGQFVAPLGPGPLLATTELFLGKSEGELLFEIDPRPYQAQLDQAEGQVRLYEAQLELAKTTLARDREIAKTPGAVSLQQLDQDKAAVDEADARVKAFKASTEVYKLNLGFTKVTSPIDGQISRYYLTVGNLVNQDQTLLTTVVSLDPMHVYFDMDEPTLQRVRKAINEGRIKLPQGGEVPVLMGLQADEGYPRKGTINFVNNQVSATTGSIQVRGVFPNPRPPGGVRLLSPGMFARIRLPLGQPHKELLVIDRAISSDLGLKYVYVMDADNKIRSQRVTTGALQEDGLRVISEGLKPDDWVVVGAIQQVRPKLEIRPEETSMPSLGRQTAAEPDKEKGRKGDTETKKQTGDKP
jgi:multidrug efflux system membrane fusion protein